VGDVLPDVTDRQRLVLAALAADSPAYTVDLAHALGYRPARSGRLAVTATLRSMLVPGTDRGLLVGRIPPRDQWSSAMWSITDLGRAAANVKEPARG